MKDIKHYFVSPKKHSNASMEDFTNSNHNNNVEVTDVQDIPAKDKKRRKRKLSDDYVPNGATVSNCEKKKRTKSDVLKSKILEQSTPDNRPKRANSNQLTYSEDGHIEETKGVKRSKNSISSNKKSRESNSSKENSTSEIEDKECTTPDSSKGLFSYFSKVDKLLEMPEKPKLVKVKAVVHADSSGNTPTIDTSSSKRYSRSKKKKAAPGNVDFDVITCEDIPNDTKFIESPLSSNNVNCYGTGGDNINDKCKATKEDVIFIKYESPKNKPKVKHDGTLSSFFNLGNRPPPVPIERKVTCKASGSLQPINKIAMNLSGQDKPAPFPLKSHVQQKEIMNIMWNLRPIRFAFMSNDSQIKIPTAWSGLLEIKRNKKVFNNDSEVPVVPFDSKTALRNLKKELNLFPISCWHKELKKMRKGNITEMWTERYRPHSSSNFLANSRSIAKLKAWLIELKETSSTDARESSGDEFVKDFEGEKKSDKKTVILLTGPPGTGKTAAVYAIAEENGYNVLETNASYIRSGRKIISEFSEATKSHKVGLSKLNFSKTKKKVEDPKRSLILIEDADLLYDDDDGFVPTLMNLGASTKRPIILIANNNEAKHFNKLSTLFHCTLEFVPPTPDRLGSWLRTLSIVEGFSLSQEESENLASSQDLRKSLLQLQFSEAFSKANKKKNDVEEMIWGSAGNLDLSSKKQREKALKVVSALSVLDFVSKNQTDGVSISRYWCRAPEDSTINTHHQEMPPQNLDGFEATLLGLVSSKSTSCKKHYFEIPRNLLEVEKDVCSMTSLLKRRSNALDIWPVLRGISRHETARLTSHTKRNNRYFNYLTSLGVKGPPDLIQSFTSTFS